MTAITRPPPYLLSSWANTLGPVVPPRKPPVQAAGDRYASSFVAGGQQSGSWAAQYGDDTTNVFAPRPQQSLLAGLLSKLPEFHEEGRFRVGGSLVSAEGEFNEAGGAFRGQGMVTVGEVVVSGEGSVGLKEGAFTAQGNLHAQVTAIDASGSLHLNPGELLGIGNYGIDLAGSTHAGAKADAHGRVVIDPKNGVLAGEFGAGMMVGARAAVGGSVTLGKFGGASYNGEVWAGVGADLQLRGGFEDGKLKFGADFGLALLIGVRLGFDVSIDVRGIVNAVKDAFNGIGNFVTQDVGKVAGEVLETVGDGVSGAAKTLGKAAESVVGTAVGAVSSVANTVGEAASSIADAVSGVFDGW